MNSAARSSANEVLPASTAVFVATFAAVLAATVILLFVDIFLARVDHRESEAHAAAEYAAGRTLLSSGNASAARERFGAAVAIDRRNVSYALALAEATLEEGQFGEAEAMLRDLLARAENDGAVNLTMAHVMVRQQRDEESKAYFHRAIFGHWGSDSVARRIAARFELIDVLTRQGAARELLAELLPFEAMAPDSTEFRIRLGQLFMAAGSPTRAATTFRAVLRRDPHNADAYAGMGQAALELGNLRTARADLAEAARLRPDDARIASSLAIADTVDAMDPTARDIGAPQRYARSRALLMRTISTLRLCADAGVPVVSDSVTSMLTGSVKPAKQDADADAMVTAAGTLWAVRPVSCAPAARDTVLRLIQIHLAQ